VIILSPTNLDNIQWLREQVRNTAEFYSTRIREYIVNNQVQFPEYFNPSQNLLSIKPKWNNYLVEYTLDQIMVFVIVSVVVV